MLESRNRSRLSALCLVVVHLATGCDPPEAVTVYTSVDEVYSRPILEAFERSTGIAVRALYDVEAQKTTGLYQRLLAERDRPRADVFWNSEVARTVQLAREGLLAPLDPPGGSAPAPPQRDRRWAACALRARVILYHRDRLRGRPPPRSLVALIDPLWRGDAAIARPLFGTTATHAGALYAVLGKEAMEAFFRRLLANDVRVVEGNAVVRNLVARGEVAFGLTDTDDAHEAVRRGDPVEIVYPDQEAGFPGVDGPLGTFVIATTVSLVSGAPHPELGRQLATYLLGPAVEEALARSSAAFLPLHRPEAASPALGLPRQLVRMQVSDEDVAAGVEASRAFLQELFLR